MRVRSFNGLHLVMQTRADHPETAIIIITGYDDPLIDLEAHRYHADLVRKPIRPAEFRKRVNEALAGVRRQRRWPRKRVVGGFRVTIKGRPAAVASTSGSVRTVRRRISSSKARRSPRDSAVVRASAAAAADSST